MAKRKTKAPTTSGNVPTNYGMGVLTDGTKITYLQAATGKVYIETPTELKGKEIAKVTTAPGSIWHLV